MVFLHSYLLCNKTHLLLNSPTKGRSCNRLFLLVSSFIPYLADSLLTTVDPFKCYSCEAVPDPPATPVPSLPELPHSWEHASPSSLAPPGDQCPHQTWSDLRLDGVFLLSAKTSHWSLQANTFPNKRQNEPESRGSDQKSRVRPWNC